MMNEPEYNISENGNKIWRLHGKLHRKDAPAIEWKDGSEEWWLHGKRHRDDAPAIEDADGHKQWWLHGKKYNDVNAWAKDVLKMHNKPHDDANVQDYLRNSLMKDDLI
jgi:hypothetical protein